MQTDEQFADIVCNIFLMKKLAINYSRQFPEHRVPFDFEFNKQLMRGPSYYFSLVRAGYNATLAKNFHVFSNLGTLVALTVGCFYVHFSTDCRQTDIDKVNFPTYKFVILTKRGGYGAYDNILQGFENEKGGLRDQPFDL